MLLVDRKERKKERKRKKKALLLIAFGESRVFYASSGISIAYIIRSN